MGNNFHRTDDQLELYALGRLPEPVLQPLEEHLLICTVCQEKLSGIGDFALAMRAVLDTDVVPSLAESGARRFGWGWISSFPSILRRPAFPMGLAFAALLVVAGVFSFGRTHLAPNASLQLTAMRGEMPITVPARELDLTLSSGPRDEGPFRVDVLNATGVSVSGGSAESSPAGVKFRVTKPLQQGDYFVRLYSASGKMLHEYGFRVRT